jgi:hypothetical protein
VKFNLNRLTKSRTFQDGAAAVMGLPFPKFTASKAYAAREKLVDAFTKFYSHGDSELASQWVRRASEISESYGVDNVDKARMDVANSNGILANTTPTAFWTIYHIFSDQVLLEEIRNAVLPLLSVKQLEHAVNYELNTSQIKDVPILKSVIHEALRYYSHG